LIAAAKAQPGRINYASSGPGSGGHMSVELLQSMTGINVVHIPYKGAGPALVDVVDRAGADHLYQSLAIDAPCEKRSLARTGHDQSRTLAGLP